VNSLKSANDAFPRKDPLARAGSEQTWEANMHTVIVVLVAIFAASWWFKRCVAKSHTTISSANLERDDAMDRPGAGPANNGGTISPEMSPALVRPSGDDDRLPSLCRVKNDTVSDETDSQLAQNEIYTPIRRRFLELKSEAAAIIERHREQQATPNDQLARELSALRKQMERLQQEANREMETIHPKILLDFIRQRQRNNCSEPFPTMRNEIQPKSGKPYVDLSDDEAE
jgi:hypothetical protein